MWFPTSCSCRTLACACHTVSSKVSRDFRSGVRGEPSGAVMRPSFARHHQRRRRHEMIVAILRRGRDKMTLYLFPALLALAAAVSALSVVFSQATRHHDSRASFGMLVMPPSQLETRGERQRAKVWCLSGSCAGVYLTLCGKGAGSEPALRVKRRSWRRSFSPS